ncbi:NEW3 domain-containing protein [Streptacidiphilus sp. P02-A3a]|uniref:NEW3 domain-containing protein n=1 Tax=Streptacidiphilus sp. P02-A3a TaxID=2704468 RepID=UPI00351A151C
MKHTTRAAARRGQGRTFLPRIVLVLSLAVPALGVTLGTAAPAQALDNGLALTPPMGWNDWNAFGCDVSAKLVEQTADKIVSSGLKADGYEYVNIDDCWMSPNRDAAGNLVPDPVKFPDGIKGVADYVHKLGLKLGIYESAGSNTCQGYPGSLGHEQQDADSFASWGVDYLKYDNCYNEGIPALTRYTAMRDALARTGRPIVFSLCDWGDENVASWGGSVGDLWRTTGDINASYASMLSNFHTNVALAAGAGPGAWNDPDMLEVGNGMTPTEDRSEFSLWAEMAAPLISGTDLTTASPATLAIYGNKEVIAVDQDSLGKQGVETSSAGGLDVLAKPLSDGSVAVALFNENDTPATISTTAAAAGLPRAEDYTERDLWAHTTTESRGTISAFVPAHGTVLYRVAAASRADRYAPSGTLAEAAPQQATAGQPSTVTTTYTDNGSAVGNVRLGLDAPRGWSVKPLTRTRFGRVATGHEAIAAFKVTPPATLPAPIADYTLDATADATWSGGTEKVTTPAAVSVPAPVRAPWKTFTDNTATFGQQGGNLAIQGAGADLYGSTDQYSTVYQQGAEHDGSTTVVKLTAQADTSVWAKAGIMVRDDITQPGVSPGYVILAEAPGEGYVVQWDSTGSGQLDSNSAPADSGSGTASYPTWLKLVRSGDTYTGYYSTDDSNWTLVGTATAPGATATQDVGVFTSSHSAGTIGEADFSDFSQS